MLGGSPPFLYCPHRQRVLRVPLPACFERTKSLPRWSLPPLLHFQSPIFRLPIRDTSPWKFQQRDLGRLDLPGLGSVSLKSSSPKFHNFLFCSKCNFLYRTKCCFDETKYRKRGNRRNSRLWILLERKHGAIIDKLFEDGRAPVMRAFFRRKKQLLRVNLGRLTSSKNRRFFVTLVTLTRAECVSLLLLIFPPQLYIQHECVLQSCWKMLEMPINLAYVVLSRSTSARLEFVCNILGKKKKKKSGCEAVSYAALVDSLSRLTGVRRINTAVCRL